MAIPVEVECGKCRLDDLRILHIGHADIPFQSIGLRRLGKIGRANVCSAIAGVAFKDIRFGMQTFYLRVIGDSDFSIWKLRQSFHSFGLGNATIGCGDNAQLVVGILTEMPQMVIDEVDTREFEKGDDEADAVGALNIAFNLRVERHQTLPACEEAACAEARQRSHHLFACSL